MIGWHLGVMFLVALVVWVSFTVGELEQQDSVGFTLWLMVVGLFLFAIAQGFLRPLEQVTLI